MKLPWQKADDSSTSEAPETATETAAVWSTAVAPEKSAPTPGKGRPTPSRRESEGRRRGPVAPAPLTRGEARQRRKEIKNSMSKEEKKAAAADRRAAVAERRELMMQGDDRYLLPRDKGPVKAFARDLVDSRRHIATLFIPLAVVAMIFVFATTGSPALSGLGTMILLVFVVFMAIEGFFTGRRVNNQVREKYPDTAETGFRLGWYAFMRSTQLRRMRTPRPRAEPGDVV